MPKKSNPLPLWQRIRRDWYWLAFAVFALAAIGYSFYRRDSQGYWDGAIGNWLATLLGIIAGVPIALAIERQKISREEQERAAEHRERAIKVSFLIRDELVYNSNRLAERLNNKVSLPLLPFKNDLWRALSDSGEIRWIDNPPILNKIASAYYYIGVVSAIEDKCYQAIRGINPRYEDGTLASQRLLEDARKFDAELSVNISAAIRAIEETVGNKSAS